MVLSVMDGVVIGLFFLIIIGISIWAAKTSGKSKEEYFLAGKSMPWWLLGFSMVATTFSADTPNLVTGFVREEGIAKNWLWWSFLITGMVTVFIYAKLWRRSGLLTDLEFYEIRYGGKAAAFLRGFRALYLGLFFNCLIMGSVLMAGIKISSILLGLTPLQTVLISSVIVAVYSSLGGIRGVIWTDFFQFGIAFIGAVYAAYVAVIQPEVGGLHGLLQHEAVQGRLAFMPDLSDTSTLVSMFIIPLAVQWWSVWYPGSEPGGGGYIAQRMLAAKDERHAVGATLFFNFAHYALRPWPWIIVALASLVLFPDLASIHARFPTIEAQYLGEDTAYPVMLTLLSSGWLGLVIASLIAAFTSTVSTHLNWGSSYLVNDFYQRFIRPEASERELVNMGRLFTIVLMAVSGVLALTIMENASQAFNILLLSGAGTGAIFLLRWFWWRINVWSEIAGMMSSATIAIMLTFCVEDGQLANAYLDAFAVKLLVATFGTTLVWVLITYLTGPEKKEVLEAFVQKVKPEVGWKRFTSHQERLSKSVLKVFIGTVGTYAALFAIGNFVLGQLSIALVLSLVCLLSGFMLFRGIKG